MPFTLSHVAAVLPAHRWLSRLHVFSAAVIGSMVPDFGVILYGGGDRWRTHSVIGLFIFCLPVGLAFLWLSRYLIRPALVAIVPDGPHARLVADGASARPLGLHGWCYAAVAILLGAITHLVWDAFTHERAAGVRMFPLLEQMGPELEGHALRLWRWLQYGSSILGMIAVIVALRLWVRHASAPAQSPERTLSRRERWLWSAAYVAVPLLSLVPTIVDLHHRPLPRFGLLVGDVMYALMRGVLWSLVGVSLGLIVRLRRGRRTGAADRQL